MLLMNLAATLQCAHGGVFPLATVGPRPVVGGAPGLTAPDVLGRVAVGCNHKRGPCTVTGVVAGVCLKVLYGPLPALNQGIVCTTTTGDPTLPCANPGQQVVLGT